MMLLQLAWLIVRAISFQDFQPTCSWSTSVTDGQTDGRTDDMQSQYRALHYSAWRGKKPGGAHNATPGPAYSRLWREHPCPSPYPSCLDAFGVSISTRCLRRLGS